MRSIAKREAVLPTVGARPSILAGWLVEAILKRIPEFAATPRLIVAALESELGSRATAAQKVDAMLAVSAAIGESVSGPFVIDKEMADEMIGRNESNRAIGPAKLQQYIEDMGTGRWDENGGGVTLSRCGCFNDGQHRAHAISRTNTQQRMNLTVGVTRDSRRTVDIGKTRTSGDQLKQEGFDYANILAALARALIAYEHGNQATVGRPAEISSTEVQERVRNDPQIMASAKWAKQNARHLKHQMTATIAGFVHYLLNQIDAADAEIYLNGVLTGAENGRGLDLQDPRWIVRDRLHREQSANTSPNRVELLFRGWNAHRGVVRGTAIRIQNSFPGLTTEKHTQQR